MKQNEVYIQVKPSEMADVVAHHLTQRGFNVVGGGSMVVDGEWARDLWFEVPNGTNTNEYKFVQEPP